jgi:hypothetical protein
MIHRCSFALLVIVALALGAAAAPAAAVEYRLQVVNVRDEALTSFLKPGEARDGATGPGLQRLEASLDGGDFPKAVLLYDRHLQAASASAARAYGGVPVRADVTKGGEQKQRWDEVRWDGTPGEQSMWVVAPSSRRPGELYRTAIKGVGPIRHFLPYTVTNGGTKYPVARFPLNYLFAHEDDADFWTKRLAPVLDLGGAIGVIVAANDGVFRADEAYVIVTHTAEPAAFKAVLGWRDRKNDRESPSLDGILRINIRR